MLNKTIKHIIPVILAVLITIPAFAAQVNAATKMPTITAYIPVKCDEVGGEFTIEAKENAPMPLKPKLVISDKSDDKFEITYNEPGNYSYVIRQSSGTRKNVTYDDVVYDVTVHVYSNDSGVSDCKVVINRQGSNKKNDSALFHNKQPEDKNPKGSKSNPGKGGGTKSVKTGDIADIEKWACVIAIAGVCLMALLFRKLKARKSDRS
jgi:pilin isopeptide linkage protein